MSGPPNVAGARILPRTSEPHKIGAIAGMGKRDQVPVEHLHPDGGACTPVP